MAALMRGDLREHSSQAHPQKPRNRRCHLHPRKVQTFRPLELDLELPLQVQETGYDRGKRLSVKRLELAGGVEFEPRRGTAELDDEPFHRPWLERSKPLHAARAAILDRRLDSPEFHVPNNDQVCQTFLDRPFVGRGPPVEAGLVQPPRQLLGFDLNLLKLLMILSQFRDGHKGNYSAPFVVCGAAAGFRFVSFARNASLSRSSKRNSSVNKSWTVYADFPIPSDPWCAVFAKI